MSVKTNADRMTEYGELKSAAINVKATIVVVLCVLCFQAAREVASGQEGLLLLGN